MQFNLFHLMPYPYLPDDFDAKYDTASLTLPNGIFDPKRGVALYNAISMNWSMRNNSGSTR